MHTGSRLVVFYAVSIVLAVLLVSTVGAMLTFGSIELLLVAIVLVVVLVVGTSRIVRRGKGRTSTAR